MIQDWLLAIINSYKSDGYYKFGNIPPAKLAVALQHYPVDPNDTPMALIDATVFGSAKYGMVIGLKGIYWNNDWSVPTEKKFLSWEELASSPTPIAKKFFVIELIPGCEFDMSGCSMSKTALVSLLERIIDLYERSSNQGIRIEKKPQEGIENILRAFSDDCSSSADFASVGTYVDSVPKLLAVCMAADGEIGDSQVELATAIIESDELIQDKQSSLESLLLNVDKLISDKKKSNAIFRLRSNTIFAKIATIKSEFQKARLAVILEGISESANGGKTGDKDFVLDTLRKILAAADGK